MTIFFYLECFQDSSILYHVSVLHSLLLNNIPLCAYTSFCLSIHQLIDIWVLFTFWLPWIMLPWTFVYKFLCGCLFSFRSEVELLGHTVPLKNCQTVFQNSHTILPATSNVWRFQCVILNTCYCLVFFFNSSPLNDCEVVSHCGFDFCFPNECWDFLDVCNGLHVYVPPPTQIHTLKS